MSDTGNVPNATSGSIRTTDGLTFTHLEHVDMARMVYKRFGHNADSACAAWRRLLENGCDVEHFMKLVVDETHSAHCEGHCRLGLNHDSRG